MDNMEIAVRSFVQKAEQETVKRTGKFKKSNSMPSGWVLAFDTETTTCPAQKLRFGTYLVTYGKQHKRSGVFYSPDTLTRGEQQTLRIYAEKNSLEVLTVTEFIEEIFYGIGYFWRASIVGFNLPFDISRLAIDHGTSRGTSFSKLMQNGYSFKLSENPFHPRVQVKHVSSKHAFIRFASTIGQRNTRGQRKKGKFFPVRRGFFVDVRTLSSALMSKSHSLDSLAKVLDVESQKHKIDEHGKTLTNEYIEYAVQDTQATWECYQKLQALYESYELKTPSHKIHSEASLGKAYFKQMGIHPWKIMQPDFPPEIIGKIMSTYYGGRSEVCIRRQPVQVLYCDFLSMYPTVCTLMGLWKFVIAKGVNCYDSTETIQEFLEKVTIADLQNPDTWKNLHTIVQVQPDKDIFPVRGKYSEKQYTIGANHLTSGKPMWFTLADCIAAKLLTGKTPKVIKATSFKPKEAQEKLSKINVAGNENYQVNPYEDDFFKKVIDLRREVKGKMKTATAEEKENLDSLQLAFKLLANSTSYGVFVEFNVEEERNLQELLCFSETDNPIPTRKKKFEASGSYFHPLLATLITGAARLKLAISETLATNEGLDWAFCDTDSMALSKPENMSHEKFIQKATKVRKWFTPLSPYESKPDLFKLEDENYNLSGNGEIEPLFCHAVSSKRYALFNFDKKGKVVLRKVSSHGLGHLLSPYTENNKQQYNNVKAPIWHQDLWLEIITAELQNKPPNYSKLKNFNTPAISRYAATNPTLLNWFKKHNQDKPYIDTVKPFNFMLSAQVSSLLEKNPPKPVAPYNKNLQKAQFFDRETGKKVPKNQLKTYTEALSQYHLHPEDKFLNGNFLDKGKTQRRHIIANQIQHIGKEANKWEEQSILGLNAEEQIKYGISKEQKEEQLKTVLKAIKTYGAKPMAGIAKLSPSHVSRIQQGNRSPSDMVIQKLYFAAKILEKHGLEKQKMLIKIQNEMKKRDTPLRALAKELGMDASNLSKVLKGKKNLNTKSLSLLVLRVK